MKIKNLLLVCFSLSGLAFQPVDINLASDEQIALLPGLGKAFAARLIAYRRQHGPVNNESDLLKVPGMSANKLERIRTHIVFYSSKPKAKAAPRLVSAPVLLSLEPEVLIDLAILENRVLAVAGLNRSEDLSLAGRVRKANYLPELVVYADVDRGSAISQKAMLSNKDTSLERSVFGLGFGVKAVFDLPDLIFNKEELNVANLALKRSEQREKLIAKLHVYYFRMIELNEQGLVANTASVIDKIKQERTQVKAELNYLSQGEFSLFQQNSYE